MHESGRAQLNPSSAPFPQLRLALLRSRWGDDFPQSMGARFQGPGQYSCLQPRMLAWRRGGRYAQHYGQRDQGLFLHCSEE
ncbi:hypothetical protein BDZ89DRAFT_544270 [Hymenopellis radicata]|nr:hypothetical protein BDZ89DRAFT_544270 [Hymenopellis radicata]